MKQSSLVDSYSYSKLFSCIFILLSFCIIFVPTTHARAIHRRLWPFRSWPKPYPPMYQPKPWPQPYYQPGPWPIGDPPTPEPKPAPSPSPSPKPIPPPGPSPLPPIPPTPQPKPSPPHEPSPCPPPPAPKPEPKPPSPPAPSPSPNPGPCPSNHPGPCPFPPEPAPHPEPYPDPHPEPYPGPYPGPHPAPHPCPYPGPYPAPYPCPYPGPNPGPYPGPDPGPYPGPHPIPPYPPHKNIPAVYFFGDSVFDTGNNNERKTPAKSNYRPYGMNFRDGVATGRFSNGMIASDFLAKYLGVKEYVPAYLDPKVQPHDLLTGVSFASAGAGYDPPTSEDVKAITMLDQLRYFQNYTDRMRRLVIRGKDSETELLGLERTNELLARGIAFVVAGANDLAITYFGSGSQRLKSDIDSFTTLMADSAASFVLQLYGYGARRIGVIGTPPLGCTPSERKGRKKKKCNEDLNYASQLFNSKLLLIMGQLSKTLPNSTLVYMDIYSIFSQIIETPEEYGFEEIRKPCCKTKAFVGYLCKKRTSKICSNTSSYLFWDGVHPTQRAYQIINKILVHEYLPLFSTDQ